MTGPAYVQHATNSASFTSGASGAVTVAISAAGAGNCLVAAINASGSNGTPSVTSVKTGSSAENWAKGVELDDASNTAAAAIWADPDTAGGGTTVVVTVAFGATASSANSCEVFVDVFEFSGVASSSPVDKTSAGATGQNSSSWTAGTTGTTAQAGEVAVGTVGATALSGTSTVTGPGGSWVNESTLSGTVTLGGTGYDTYAQSGYEILSSTGTVTYSGSTSASTLWDAVALTLKGASGPTITTSSLPGGTAGTAYSQAVSATGGTTPYTWSVSAGSLPSPLTINGSTGVISGTPTAAGASSFTVECTDAASGTATQPLSITVATAFPASPLDLRCELDLAGTWTDVSPYVYQRDGNSPPVSLTRGRADESSQANPGAAAWEWNNRDGRFSPKNPLSPYYGELGRNTPVRWSVPAQSGYLRLEDDTASCASCPDASGLHVTGDIDIRIDLKLTSYAVSVLCAKWGAAGSYGWLLELNASGALQFYWSTTGSDFPSAASTAPLPVAGRQAVRVALAVSTGTVTFYTGPAGGADGGTWTQLGAAVVAGSTSIYATTAALAAGNQASGAAGVCGGVWEMEVRSGIGGTTVAHPVFSSQAAGVTSFTDAQGNAWALTGTAEISARDYRFHGQMSAQPPRWDVTGADMAVKAAAGGLLRLINQGQAPLMSPMRRAYTLIQAYAAPVAYWPMEDSAGSTQLAPGAGGVPMYFSGSPELSSSTAFACSLALPAANGASFSGRVPPASWTANVTRFLMEVPSGGEAGGAVIASVYSAGTVALLQLAYDAGGGLTLTGYSAAGAQLFTSGPVSFTGITIPGGPVRVSMELQPSGGNVSWAIVVLSPGAVTAQESTGTLSSASVGAVAQVILNPNGTLTGTVLGHCSVQAAWDTLFDLGGPLDAWTGEAAGTRFARLAGENGYQARVVGAPAASAAMGAQAVDTLANLLQACEDADRGQVFEPRQALALGYRTLRSMYNQAPRLVLDYSRSEPGGAGGNPGDSGLDPTYDDQQSRNDWTLTRSAGSGADGATFQFQLDDGSAMSVSSPPAGIGDYADTLSVNVECDAQLPNVAGWMVHVGTVDEARWPSIPLNLARPAMAALYWDALDADIGDYLQIVNAPDLVVYGPVKQLAFQQAEQLGGFHYAMAFNAVPESPYEVAAAGAAHAATAGSQLASGCSSTATSLSVATTAGNIWTTSSGDFPFSIMVAGEEMTVTNITGASSPQAFTVTRSANGVVKAQSSGAAVQVYPIPVAAL